MRLLSSSKAFMLSASKPPANWKEFHTIISCFYFEWSSPSLVCIVPGVQQIFTLHLWQTSMLNSFFFFESMQFNSIWKMLNGLLWYYSKCSVHNLIPEILNLLINSLETNLYKPKTLKNKAIQSDILITSYYGLQRCNFQP